MSKIKSVRLTKDSRIEILDSIMAQYEISYFEEETYKNEDKLRDAIRGELDDTLCRLWMATYGEYIRLLVQLPEALLATGAFQVISGSRCESKVLKGMPAPTCAASLVLEAEEFDKVFAPVIELREALKEFEGAYKSFRKEALTVLEAASTTKQLVELWPTVEKFIPAHIADPDRGIQLPMLLVSRLDEKLGGAQ